MRYTGILGPALALGAILHLATAHFFDRAEGIRRISKRDDDDDDSQVLQIPLRNFGNQQYTVHIQMAKPAVWFNFSLANTHGYTAVAGVGCNGCCEDPHEGLYNAAASSTYQAPLAAAQNITFQVGGKTCTGQKATENCAFKQQTDNGTKWWEYDDQHIIVASNGSSPGVFGTSAGLAGLGYSSVANGTDSIIGKYLSAEANPLEIFTFAISLFGIGSTTAPNGAQLVGDSSGGYMHLNGPDPTFYSGSISTLPVAGSDTTVNWGAVPAQVGSYDWSVQMQGWVMKTQNNQGELTITGGQGTYATMEAGYPYILLPQADASKIYAAISGAQTYIVPTGATGANGVPINDDALALSWSVPCSTTDVAVYVNFNGTSIPIQPSDLWTTIGGVCVGNIKGWADPTRTTAIMGSSFFRNAYVVFSASQDTTKNTIGIAARPTGAKASNNTKIIIGSVIGGVAFVAFVIFAGILIARCVRRRRTAPSSEFVDHTTNGSRTMTAVSLDREKSPGPRSGSSYLGSLLGHGKQESLQDYVAEPWTPPPGSTGSPGLNNGQQQIVVQSWRPTVPGEQAFLSPTGTAGVPPYQQHPPQPQPQPQPPNASAAAGGYVSYPSTAAVLYNNNSATNPVQNSSMSGHSAVVYPNTGGGTGQQRPMSEGSWVSANTQPTQSAISGQFTPPPPQQGQQPFQQQQQQQFQPQQQQQFQQQQQQRQQPSQQQPAIMQVHPPGTAVSTSPGSYARVRPLPVPGATRNSTAM